MITTLITPLTSNAKLGASVATSYRPVGDSSKGTGTCPSKCPLLPENGGLCYTRKFLVNNQQKKSNLRTDDFSRFLLKQAKFIRLHTSGDFFLNGKLDEDYLKDFNHWVSDKDVTAWTYTHDISQLIGKGYSYKNKFFSKNFHLVASCDSLEEKKLANDHGFRSARVIEHEKEKLEDETLCPYDLALAGHSKPSTTCAKCTLCFNPKHKKNIAFIRH